MAIVMRIVQRFQTCKRNEFMELERQFAALEPFTSREPGNTLIWQARFDSLSAAENALKTFESSSDHTRLYNQQKQYMEDTWVEFYEVLDY